MKNLFAFFLTFVLILLTSLRLISQGNEVAFDTEGWKRQNNVVPPSPQAASLGNFGNVPLNYYNGSASISIPLTSVGGQQISVPLSLSYDASSVKVAQLPTQMHPPKPSSIILMAWVEALKR